MEYFDIHFTLSAKGRNALDADLLVDATDLLCALAGEAGLESFDEQADGLHGYVQQPLFDEALLQALLADFPFPDICVSYTVCEAQSENWNAQWEQEGFTPILLGDMVRVHSSQDAADDLHFRYDIRIHPEMAFGTGHHVTTRMMMQWLLETDLEGLTLIDAGCGTGILSILAGLRGAGKVLAYDIDSWSQQSAINNLAMNGVLQEKVLLGDASVLASEEALGYLSDGGRADVLLANINRNILLADMPRFARCLHSGGCLFLSGFYVEDVPALVDAAKVYGLTLQAQKSTDGWASLKFEME